MLQESSRWDDIMDNDGGVEEITYSLTSESAGGLGNIERFKIGQESYNFFQHPQVVRDRINIALEAGFNAFLSDQESLFGEEIPLDSYPTAKGKIKKGEILVEKSQNGLVYLYVNIFGRDICLGYITKNENFGKGQGKNSKVVFRCILKSRIIGDITGVGNSQKTSSLNMLRQVKDMLEKISPHDFHEDKDETEKELRKETQKDLKEKETLIKGQVDNISYETYSFKGSEDIHLEFTHSSTTYHSMRLIEHSSGNKKEYYVAPEGLDAKNSRRYIKKLGGSGKNPKSRVERLLKRIINTIIKGKDEDKDIIVFLESLRVSK